MGLLQDFSIDQAAGAIALIAAVLLQPNDDVSGVVPEHTSGVSPCRSRCR